MRNHPSNWYVYMVRCADNSLYTGIAKDIDTRIQQHNHNNRVASRYTKTRRPVTLVYQEQYKNRSEASKREALIKKLKKPQKEQLIKQASV